MKTVILGAGKRGTALAHQLVEEEQDVVLIDNDDTRLRLAADKVDCMTIQGSGTDLETLRKAEIQSEDTFVAVTNSDEINLVGCGIANSEFKVANTVAAIRNLAYTGKDGLSNSILGITYMVNPEAEAARTIYNTVARGIYSDVITFQNTPLILYNATIPWGSEFAGKNLQELRTSIDANFVVAAINHDLHAMVPSGKTVIHEGDIVSFVANETDVKKILQIMGHKRTKPRRIVIVGGTQIARFLLANFGAAARGNIVLIDEDAEVLARFAENYPEILTLKGDITEENILEDEGLSRYDLLVSLQDSDETNLLTACYSKRIGIRHTMALVRNNPNYTKLADSLGIDAVFSTTDSTVNSLLKFIRSSGVSSVQSLFGGAIEVFEFLITPESAASGKRLMDLDIRGKGIIAGITTAKKKVVIPTGTYELQEGDSLVIAANPSSVTYIKQLFG